MLLLEALQHNGTLSHLACTADYRPDSLAECREQQQLAG